MPDDDLVEGRDDLETAADDEMGGKMSFLDHLDELRRRIIYAVLSVGIGFVIAFFFIDDIFNFVMRPMQQLLPPGGTLVYTDPTEAFMLYIKIALISGLLLASPAVFTQVWLFVAPASMRMKVGHSVRVMSSFFFILGVVFTRGRLSDHLALLRRFHERHRHVHAADRAGILDLRLILALGITFQLPTLVLFLARMGMITPRFMIRNFKYAVLLIIIAAAVLSPDGGGVGLIAMGGPVVLLYVFSIGLAWRSAGRSATPTPRASVAAPSVPARHRTRHGGGVFSSRARLCARRVQYALANQAYSCRLPTFQALLAAGWRAVERDIADGGLRLGLDRRLARR